ncbi:MAG: type VI secretion system tip protein VgrG [Bacteroidota bacterium]
MSAPSPLAAIQQDSSLRFTITLDGAVMKDSYGVSSVNITHAVNRISYAEIVLQGEVGLGDGTLPLSDGDDFKPGKDVVITAGYGNSGETGIFKGVIVKHAVIIDEESGYSFRMLCKHKAVGMTFNEDESVYTDKLDSDIMTALIGNYSGLTADVTATTTQHPFVFQKVSTDWDFLLARAEFNGYIVTLDTDKVIVGAPKVGAEPVLSLTLGESIIAFSAELNAENQPPSMEAHAWDPKTLADISSTAAEPTVNAQGSVTATSMSSVLSQKALKLISPTPMVTDELKSWAEGKLLRKRLSAFKGTVKFIGSPLVKAGSLVELAGVGTKFNGKAFVSSVTHTLDGGAWNTTIKIGLENTPIHLSTGFTYGAAGGQLPAVHGLQVGLVKKLSADPGGENRIQITLHSNASSPVDVWARFVNFYGSNGVGLGFLPEIGDEVAVGFFDGDPRYPVIVGSMYSSKNKSPNPPADENNYIKSITTKSKLKITMDDEKKIISIETPGGNKITFSDDAKSIEIVDQSNNSLKMTSSGIDLKSDKDITIKATGGITLDATGKLTLKAQQDVAVTGLNVTATANIGFTAKGNATAELSASGQITVKGAMVMIN